MSGPKGVDIPLGLEPEQMLALEQAQGAAGGRATQSAQSIISALGGERAAAMEGARTVSQLRGDELTQEAHRRSLANYTKVSINGQEIYAPPELALASEQMRIAKDQNIRAEAMQKIELGLKAWGNKIKQLEYQKAINPDSLENQRLTQQIESEKKQQQLYQTQVEKAKREPDITPYQAIELYDKYIDSFFTKGTDKKPSKLKNFVDISPTDRVNAIQRAKSINGRVPVKVNGAAFGLMADDAKKVMEYLNAGKSEAFVYNVILELSKDSDRVIK